MRPEEAEKTPEHTAGSEAGRVQADFTLMPESVSAVMHVAANANRAVCIPSRTADPAGGQLRRNLVTPTADCS